MKKLALLLVATITLVFAFSVFIPTPTVQAGKNGQQLEIQKIMGRGARVTVTGKNQNGYNVTWTGYTPGNPSQISPPSGETLKTTGYWWVGDVVIRVYWPSSSTLNTQCKKYVTKDQGYFNNWVVAKMIPAVWKPGPNTPCN